MEQNEEIQDYQSIYSQSAELLNLVQYQEDSIVSRTLINKNAGTITLFSCAKDQGLTEHTALYDTMIYIFDGEAIVTIAGSPLQLKEGDITIVPANKPHSIKAINRIKMMLVMIKD